MMSDAPQILEGPGGTHDPPLFGLRCSAPRGVAEAVIALGVFVGWGVLSAVLPWHEDLALVWGVPPLYIDVLTTGVVCLTTIAVLSLATATPLSATGLSACRVPREIAVGLLAVVPAYGIAASCALAAAVISYLLDPESLDSMIAGKAPILEGISAVSPWMVLPLMMFVAFYEELLFRGFLLGRLAAGFRRPVAAAAVTSVVFGALHYSGQGWLGVVQTTVLGAALAALTLWRGNLWPAMACHVTINSVVTFAVLSLMPQLRKLMDEG